MEGRTVLRTVYLSLSLMLFNIVGTAVAETGNPETVNVIIVQDDQPHNITSQDFPFNCCTPMKYILKQSVVGEEKYWKLLFSDVDIPPFSELLISGLQANGSEILIGAARYLGREWIRPALQYKGYGLVIEFQPAQKLQKNDKTDVEKYAGFKATYWLDQKAWELDMPFTVCPPINDAIQGGKLTVENGQLPFDPQHYRMYCVWQLKPVPTSDLHIFIRLEDFSGDDLTLQVHGGLTSVSPIKYSYIPGMPFPIMLNSTEGFYIELSKPVKQDSFTMTYGVYKTLRSDEQCIFQVDGMSMEGFRCEEKSDDWCIPQENKCDGVQDCPSGYDEISATCDKPTSTAAVSTTSVPSTTPDDCPRGRCKDGQCPRKWQEKCPEESCGTYMKRCEGTLLCVNIDYANCPGEPCERFQKTCEDGTCVSLYGKCPEDCTSSERKCSDGSCVHLDKLCPGDSCPSYKNFMCDGKCNYRSIKCNGYIQCADGQDEDNCGLFEGKKGQRWRWIFCTLLGVPFLICVCILRYKHEVERGGCTECDCCGGCTVCDGDNDTGTREETTQMNATTVVASNQSFDETQPDSPVLSAPPPSYGDVMTNQDVYVAPPEPPPSYSSVSAMN